MKKIVSVIIVLLFVALSLAGCKGSHDCPAYSQVETELPVRV